MGVSKRDIDFILFLGYNNLMSSFKKIINLVNVLFFTGSGLYLLLNSDKTFQGVLGLLLGLFFLLLFLFSPYIEKIHEQAKGKEKLVRFYLSLIPTSWPEVKKKVFLQRLQTYGLFLELEDFEPLPVEELKKMKETRMWVEGVVESVEKMSILEAGALLREKDEE